MGWKKDRINELEYNLEEMTHFYNALQSKYDRLKQEFELRALLNKRLSESVMLKDKDIQDLKETRNSLLNDRLKYRALVSELESKLGI